MTILYTFGSNTIDINSTSGIVSSVDGVNWSNLPSSFADLGYNTTTATDGTNWVTTNSFGQVATSSDLINWYPYDIESKRWLINKVIWHNNEFICVGHEKNPSTFIETAFIAKSGNGVEASWARTWISVGTQSVLFDVKATETLFFAVGASTVNLSTPILLCSSNNGGLWTPFNSSTNWVGPIYSVEFDSVTGRIWIGGKSQIATAIWNGNSTIWIINDILADNGKSKPITKIYSCVINGISTVFALTGSTVWYSTNSVDWKNTTQIGYVFSDVVQYQTSVFFTVWGPLNQFTGFSTAFDPTTDATLTLNGYNNGVQGYSLLVV
jgi:hypothetical protein